MPKVILSHPSQTVQEQLVRHYATLVKGACEDKLSLSAEETMALALFSDCSMRLVENPLYPDEASLQNVFPIQVVRPGPGEPPEVIERHVLDMEAVREALSLKLVNGSIN